MLYEKHFECKTRGIVQGKAILETLLPASATKLYTPRLFDFENINKKEFFVKEDLFDIRSDKVCDFSWKIVIRSRESGETLWVRSFSNRNEALLIYVRLIGVDIERIGNQPINLPSTWQEGDFEYSFATVQSFTATGTSTWTAPGGVTQTDYLVVGGGGAGGSGTGGGGGAGGYRTATGFSVTPGTGYTVTVGAGGPKSSTVGADSSKGSDSVFSTITSTGGGFGGTNYGTALGGSGGSGGGSSNGNTSGGSGNTPSTSPSQGNNGGKSGTWASPYTTGGGGGASAVGADGGASDSGTGGNGSSSLISGSSTTYAGGGGGGIYSLNKNAAGGTGGGGSGAGSTNSGGSAGSPNTGGGGGGSGGNQAPSWDGGSGIVILSYTPKLSISFNMPMLGM